MKKITIELHCPCLVDKDMDMDISIKILYWILDIVPYGKGLGQPACQKEWKKCKEENE
jgi:hypothetical protein